ncbi:Exonuclease 3'-5' domain-containing protein 2 [Quaeritorhiza haematococci]|nr:Exonuclease 3'-5' domain-containing protein 2 [Quaeritorhiza haematococci]
MTDPALAQEAKDFQQSFYIAVAAVARASQIQNKDSPITPVTIEAVGRCCREILEEQGMPAATKTATSKGGEPKKRQLYWRKYWRRGLQLKTFLRLFSGTFIIKEPSADGGNDYLDGLTIIELHPIAKYDDPQQVFRRWAAEGFPEPSHLPDRPSTAATLKPYALPPDAKIVHISTSAECDQAVFTYLLARDGRSLLDAVGYDTETTPRPFTQNQTHNQQSQQRNTPNNRQERLSTGNSTSATARHAQGIDLIQLATSNGVYLLFHIAYMNGMVPDSLARVLESPLPIKACFEASMECAALLQKGVSPEGFVDLSAQAIDNGHLPLRVGRTKVGMEELLSCYLGYSMSKSLRIRIGNWDSGPGRMIKEMVEYAAMDAAISLNLFLVMDGTKPRGEGGNANYRRRFPMVFRERTTGPSSPPSSTSLDTRFAGILAKLVQFFEPRGWSLVGAVSDRVIGSAKVRFVFEEDGVKILDHDIAALKADFEARLH